MVTGHDFIRLGYTPGPWFAKALVHVNSTGLTGHALSSYLDSVQPTKPLGLHEHPVPTKYNILDGNDYGAADNIAKVRATMDVLGLTPTLLEAAVMPDACPTGHIGTIPVGAIAVAKNAIHPGMHSADICCSLMLTEFESADPLNVLNGIHKVTHFGPGGRSAGSRFALPLGLHKDFLGNRFLNDDRIVQMAISHLGTQGDGNHFAFVGVSAATGKTCLVTHHGSRGPGAALYKAGMRVAERYRRKLSPATLPINAWIPADTDDGREYWEALQIIRRWTKVNHACLHDATLLAVGCVATDRFWNEHNFVFREGDLYYHAKGATPVHDGFLPDTDGTQIVPLNMAEPILLIRGEMTDCNLGFAPHGAGRNYSRTDHRKTLGDRSDADVFASEVAHIDARFFSGNIDVTELPSAYKNATVVRDQMAELCLAKVVDTIQPYGCIMAGDWGRDAPWRKNTKVTG